MEPDKLLTHDELAILAAHCKATAGCHDDAARAKALARCGWDATKVRFVGSLLARLRRHGVYVAGVDSRGELVDHIVPISMGGARLDPDNCQSLCSRCHNRKTGVERSAMGGRVKSPHPPA